MSTKATEQPIASRARYWLELTKPGIVISNVMMTAVGLCLAPALELSRAYVALVGTGLLVAGCGALNQLYERDTDALMPRTSARPLASGRCSSLDAIIVGALGLILGTFFLLSLNLLTALLGVIAVWVYLALYTPLKRVSGWAIAFGAIAGALPPVMGWTAATGTIDKMSVGLFCLLFWWQIPHFLGIAMYRAADYRRAGLKIALADAKIGTLAAVTRASTLAVFVSACLLAYYVGEQEFTTLVVLSVLPVLLSAFAPVTSKSIPKWGRRLFLSTLITLPVLLVATLISLL